MSRVRPRHRGRQGQGEGDRGRPPRAPVRGGLDNSTFVGFLIENMVEELVIAVLLTGLVVLFFLGNVRGTLISVITIPISLGMALLALVPSG